LASSLIEAAKTADSQEQKQGLIEKAQRELSSVRDWTGRVQDRDSWQEIHTQADALDKAIQELGAAIED
jgi:hypothetical protein